MCILLWLRAFIKSLCLRGSIDNASCNTFAYTVLERHERKCSRLWQPFITVADYKSHHRNCDTVFSFLTLQETADIFRKKSNNDCSMCVSIFTSFGMLAIFKITLKRLSWLTDVSLCIETVCVSGTTEMNLFNLWIPARWRNFLWLYMWGGSGSAGGASCPLQSGGRLLCGYNMAGQVYCLEKGCALVLSRLWAGTHCVWRTKTLTG